MSSLVETDLPEALTVLRDIKKSAGECLQHLRSLLAKIKERPSNVHSQGMSFLDVKNQLMASYMANLGLLMDKKTSGLTVKDDPSIDRLVENRTVLEKMRPMEHKLKYQINKVVTAYKEGMLDPNDPRKFKANFGAFANVPIQNSSDEEDAAIKEKAQDKFKAYVVPKLTPVYYSDDETAEERTKKMQEKTSKRALSSAMLREMREQFTDAPVEITESQNLHRFKDNRKMQEKLEYEENNFVRLSVSKKESAGMRKMGTMSALGSLADFDHFGEFDANTEGGHTKKRKVTHKKHKGKSFRGKKNRR
ncbi:unnamed protein product [Candidula unifasciata]|uniref:Neuroguidin n=1 Tax=Candidula unifasciata TaxID=100452 RepID=A0A8S3ZM89_9EUPU|nr:unnamed protein product [Candidula unifasciata]